MHFIHTHTTHKTHIRKTQLVLAYTFFYNEQAPDIIAHFWYKKKIQNQNKTPKTTHTSRIAPPCVPINHSLFKHNGNATRWFNLF